MHIVRERDQTASLDSSDRDFGRIYMTGLDARLLLVAYISYS